MAPRPPVERSGGLGYLLIGQPALSSTVARALATKGDQPQLIEGRYELGVVALDLTAFEYRWLRRSVTFQGWATQAAVAAQLQSVQFSVGSGGTGRSVVAVIEEITIANENAATQRFFYGVNTNANGVTSGPFFGFPADDRGMDPAGGAASAAFLATQSNAGGAFTVNRAGMVTVLPGDSKTIRGPWVLSGRSVASIASSFNIQAGAVNQIVTAGFRWYERDLLASEQ